MKLPYNIISSKISNNKNALNNYLNNNSNNSLTNITEFEYNKPKQKLKEENKFVKDLKEIKFTNKNMKNNNEMNFLINDNNIFISNEEDKEKENEEENKINNKKNKNPKESTNKKEYSIFNINNISSPYGVFSFLNEKQKLNMIVYNKKLQKMLLNDNKNYKIISGKYKIGKKNGKVKEYILNTNILIYEGEY